MARRGFRIPERYLENMADRLEPKVRAAYEEWVASFGGEITSWFPSYAKVILDPSIDEETRKKYITYVEDELLDKFRDSPEFEDALRATADAAAKATAGAIPDQPYLPGFAPPPPDQTDVTFRLKEQNPAAVSAARKIGGRVTEITDTQRGVIRKVVEEGVAAGLNPIDIARNLRDSIGLTTAQLGWVDNVRARLMDGSPGKLAEYLNLNLRDKRFDRAVKRAMSGEKPLTQDQIDRIVDRYYQRTKKYRSEVIARTETLNALTIGQERAWQQAIDDGFIDPKVLAKKWVNAKDEKVRDSHANVKYGGKKFIPFSDRFELGSGHQAMRPRDVTLPAEESIQCRCTVTYRLDPEAEEEDFGSLGLKVKDQQKVTDRDGRVKAEEVAADVPPHSGWVRDVLAEKEINEAGQISFPFYYYPRNKNRTSVNIKITKDQVKEFMQWISDTSDVYSRISVQNMIKVVEDDGRFLAQYESGESSGLYSPDFRMIYEDQLMGSHGYSTRERPIYGYLSNAGPAGSASYIDNYGSIAVKFKRAKVGPRTTFTLGDSLDENPNLSSLISHAMDHLDSYDLEDENFPVWFAERLGSFASRLVTLTASPLYSYDRTDPKTWRSRFDPDIEVSVDMDDSNARSNFVSYDEAGRPYLDLRPMTDNFSKYVEAQIWGGAPIEDIEAIYYNPDNFDEDGIMRLMELADEYGIPMFADKDLPTGDRR